MLSCQYTIPWFLLQLESRIQAVQDLASATEINPSRFLKRD
jgi:hypothetical protein